MTFLYGTLVVINTACINLSREAVFRRCRAEGTVTSLTEIFHQEGRIIRLYGCVGPAIHFEAVPVGCLIEKKKRSE